MGRVFKTSLCIIVIVGVLCLSFSAYAVDSSPSPETPTDIISGKTAEELAIYYIWLTLNAWGIYVSVDDVREYGEEVEAWLTQQVYDYLDSQPSIGGWAKWVLPWSWSWDYWGFIQGNDSFLEDCQDFAEYLVLKFSLTDNDIVVSPYEYVETIDGERFPVYVINYSTSGRFWGFPNPSGEGIDGVPFTYDLVTGYKLELTLNGSTWTLKVLNADGVQQGNASSWADNGQEFDLVFYHNIGASNNPYGLFAVRPTSTYAQGPAYFTNEQFTEYFVSGMSIATGTIVLPSDSDDYTPGDSIVITDDGPIYIEVNWPDTIDVGNLPAIVSTGKVDDPQLGSLFNWIPSFVNMASDSMDFFKQVIYMMPDQVLVCIFAVMGAGVLFGILRLMREH